MCCTEYFRVLQVGLYSVYLEFMVISLFVSNGLYLYSHDWGMEIKRGLGLGKRWAKAFEKKGTRRQRSGKGAIRKRFPLQKPRWEKPN